jgi:hypothetical protein
MLRKPLFAGFAAAAVLGLAAPAAAYAQSPGDTWNWGTIFSTDHRAKASGKVKEIEGGQIDLTGKFYDVPGHAGCSWIRFRLTDITTSHHVYRTFHNCSNAPKKLSLHGLEGFSVEAKVCRGTSHKITGRCSAYEGVWAPGG